MTLIEQGRELAAMEKQKKVLENQLTELNKSIQRKNGELVNAMIEAEMKEFRDDISGHKFVLDDVINVKQTEAAQADSESFMKAFKEHGFDIFKYTTHAQTLKATVRKEIMQENEFGEKVLPDWAAPYVQVDTFTQVKIK